jgi:hypothetical protein
VGTSLGFTSNIRETLAENHIPRGSQTTRARSLSTHRPPAVRGWMFNKTGLDHMTETSSPRSPLRILSTRCGRSKKASWLIKLQHESKSKTTESTQLLLHRFFDEGVCASPPPRALTHAHWQCNHLTRKNALEELHASRNFNIIPSRSAILTQPAYARALDDSQD